MSEENNIIDIAVKRKEFSECKHSSIIVDETLNELICEECGERINPIWYIMEIGIITNRLKRTIEQYEKRIEELKGRVRVKCRHCGMYTNIR